jgi:macrolide transport system ATP-binding/permease protein
MSWFSRIFRRHNIYNELAEEMRLHLEERTEQLMREGMSRRQAEQSARRAFGNRTVLEERGREVWQWPLAESMWADVRYAGRQLGRAPGFAVTVIVTMALGMGAAVAIFGFVENALIRPLPYKDPSRLMVMFGSIPLGPKFHLSFPDYYDLKRMNTVFTSFEVYDANGFMLTTPTGAVQAPGARVTAGFFSTLGIAPVLGRDFVAGEDRKAAPRTVILSYGAWQKRYGGRRDVLGQTVMLDGAANTIVGVLPQSFNFAPAEPADFWTAEHDEGSCRGCHWLFGLGRLKDGVTIEAARADMTALAQQLEKQYPDSNHGQGVAVFTLSDVVLGDIRPILLLLMGGAALLLLIACVNAANLLLVRTRSRVREIAVRGALGATRRRLLRQFITEALVLAGVSSVLSVTLAAVAMNLLTRLVPEEILAGMPYLQGLTLNLPVLGFAAAVALAAAGLFSLAPILSLSSVEMKAGLTEGGRTAAGTLWRKVGANLVVIELATAMVLLVVAGLLGKSLYRLLQVNPGLEPANLATLSVSAPRAGYDKDEKVISLEHEVLRRVAALPGVRAASTVNKLPIGDGDFTTSFEILGQADDGLDHEVAFRQVSPDYFKTLQTRILEGRLFAPTDDAKATHVVMINHALANRYFGSKDPVGMHINYIGAPATSAMLVVGVIEDLREGPLDLPARPAFYVPFEQSPRGFFAVIAKTSVTASSMLPAMTNAIHGIDGGLAISQASTMEQRIHDSPAAYLHRASAALVGSFAALALLLSVVGLYGVIAYSVGQRTREIGVRMALGAQRSVVYRMVLGEAGKLVVVGLAAGLLGSMGSASLMRKLLFGTQAWDAFTLASVAAVLAVFALAASYLPARRAASIDPAQSLRAE